MVIAQYLLGKSNSAEANLERLIARRRLIATYTGSNKLLKIKQKEDKKNV